jgi:hypothetical protein
MIMTGFRLAGADICETADTAPRFAVPETEISDHGNCHVRRCVSNENILFPPEKRRRFLRPKMAARDDERRHDIASKSAGTDQPPQSWRFVLRRTIRTIHLGDRPYGIFV